jgi:hypothetical protein
MTILPRGIGNPTGKVVCEGPLSLGFGRLVITFLPAEPSARFSIDETHLPFVVESRLPSDLTLRCRIAPIEQPSGDITCSAGGAWDLWRHSDGSEDIVFRGGPQFGTAVWHLHLDPSFQTGELREAPVMPDRLIRADGYPLLEFTVARLLGISGGVLIHASTAIVDGEAYVFVGHSRAGKSTIAAIAEQAGALIPTDDRTIITHHDGRTMAWGTPWHGSLVRKRPDGAPVRRIYLLEQADENRCDPLPPARAVKELFVRLIQPRLRGEEVEQTLQVLENVVQSVPTAVLHFRPTPEAFTMAIGQRLAPR